MDSIAICRSIARIASAVTASRVDIRACRVSTTAAVIYGAVVDDGLAALRVG